MPTVIRVTERTSVDDVLAWKLSADVEFVLLKSSSFLPGAQGVAVAALKVVHASKSKLTINCEFQWLDDEEEIASSILGSPFGFSLVRMASTIDFAPGISPKSGNFKRDMGRTYVEKKGCLGLGRQAALVSIDPRFPFPPKLKEDVQAGDSDFPAPSKFQNVLTEMCASIGFARALTSAVESPLVNFIYELSRNSWEHGIPHSGTASASTRAVILEKIVIQQSDQFSRYPDYLRDYLLRVKHDLSAVLGVGVLCITVVDQGDGIQATLPPRDGESDSERLERAFEDGQSRKVKGAVSRGMGLSKALSAAYNLRGMLQVCSGELLGIQDFSTGEDKYPGINLRVDKTPDEIVLGTAITLFVPESSGSLDQPSLFKG